MSPTRALVVGQIASFRDCWQFRRSLARVVGASVRTVQRAISEAKSLGLIGVARAKKNEIPSGRKGPLDCGWSHRWTIGWGKAGEAVGRAVAAARLRFISRFGLKPPAAERPRANAVGAEQASAELERRAPDLASAIERARVELSRHWSRKPRDGPT